MSLEHQQSFFKLESYFSNGISILEREFENGSIAYIDGIDEAKFNGFLQRQAHQNYEQLISDLKNFFKENAVPNWVYAVPNHIETPELQKALANHRLVFDESSTAMHLNLESIKNIETSPLVPLIIQSADTDKDGWFQVLKSGFGGTEITTNQYRKALDRAQSRNVNIQHFLGSQDGQPVSAITLTYLNDTVRIDNVATHETYQRLGYGSQMVQFAINLVKAKGFNHCFLDASSDGLNVYQKFGFEKLFTYSIYLF